GILIEHFAGAFPVWLAPVQAVVIPIREHHNAYAEEVEAQLKAQGIRVEADLRDRNMRNKIKEHRQFLVPYLLVVGDRDMEERTVSVRLRTDEDLGAIPLDQFMQMIRELAQSNSMELTLAPQAGD
ncbi:MAG: threonine--tRNA ligase, partial [Anaerolineae bacterium]|nr:threonine--tRNA ligase [Anaerolineae bacterium]